MNFLRILEKEEAEYRNAIYFQYGVVRQQIEQRMAQISVHDRLMAARHSVATCPPPPEELYAACIPTRQFHHHQQHGGDTTSPLSASL